MSRSKIPKTEAYLGSVMRQALTVTSRSVDHYVPSGTDFGFYFYEEGVRTNGWQHLHNAADSMRKLRAHHRDLMEATIAIGRHAAAVGEVLANVEHVFESRFEICQACDGEGGSGRCGVSWEDCPTCGARGIVAKAVHSLHEEYER